MSEHVKPPCVRGCTRPVRDMESGEKIGEEPKLATEGLLCPRCAKDLRTWLRQIEDLYAVLDSRPGGGASPFSPAKRQKVSGSPALIRLDVAILQDPRSSSGALYRGEVVHEPEDIFDHPSDIPGQFIAWATSLATDLNLKTRPTNLTDAIDLLAGEWFTNLCYQNWVVDLYDDTKTTRTMLRRITGTTGARPAGKCPCGNTLYEPEPKPGVTKLDPEKAVIECRKCGHRMNALALVRLAAAQRVADNNTA